MKKVKKMIDEIKKISGEIKAMEPGEPESDGRSDAGGDPSSIKVLIATALWPENDYVAGMDEMIEKAVAHARRIMIGSDSMIVPCFAISAPGKVTLIACPWENDQQKETAAVKIAEMVADPEVDARALTLVAEAWTITRRRPDGAMGMLETPSPSQCDDRTEMVIISGEAEGQSAIRAFKIVRDGKGVCLDLVEDSRFGHITSMEEGVLQGIFKKAANIRGRRALN